MSKGLEALSKIKSDHEIILFGFSTCDYEYAKEFDIIEKELTALDAIKRNPILIISLLTNNATYKYVVEVTNESERPTQEEYDLVREVLL